MIAITNLLVALMLFSVGAILAFYMFRALLRKEVRPGLRWLYILRELVGLYWAGIYLYAFVYFEDSLLPYSMAIWLLRPGIIITLTAMLAGYVICQE